MVQWPGLLSAHDMCQSAVRGLLVVCLLQTGVSGLRPPQHHQAPPQPPPQSQPQPLVSQAPALPGQMLYTQPQLKLVSSRSYAAGALLPVSPGLWMAGPLPASGLTLAPPPRKLLFTPFCIPHHTADANNRWGR